MGTEWVMPGVSGIVVGREWVMPSVTEDCSGYGMGHAWCYRGLQ